MRSALSLIGVGTLAVAGCVGSIGDPGSSNASGPGADAGTNTAPAGPAPLGNPPARLTSTQYGLTLHALFAPITVPDEAPPSDIAVGGFDDNASAQTPSAALIEAYHTSAVAVASAAMVDPKALLGCSPATRGDEDSCAAQFIATFGKKAFRHPLSTTESGNLVAFYGSLRAAGSDFVTAMTLTLEAILQSPSFLYRIEIGTPSGTPGVVQLAPYEMASRLSYLLWDTMPDDALFTSAEAGELATVAGVEKQARRLLADPRAHAAVENFHRQWLRFDTMQNLAKDPTLYPTFGTATADAMIASAEKYVDGIFFGDGSLTALLTDDHAWVNDALAPLYGVASPGSSALSLVQVDATQRSGILTNAGLMAGLAHATSDSPVRRGVFVLDRFMCVPPPPPPPNIPPAPPPSATNPKTTRDRFAQQHEQGACAGCHHTIDGIGFGFEHYDAVGQWRTKDSGFAVDASGWFVGTGDLQGTFDGAVDLGKKLAGAKSVQSCVASHWMRYALGVDASGIDPAKLQPVVDAFVASGLNMRELVVALVKSDAFRTRVAGP